MDDTLKQTRGNIAQNKTSEIEIAQDHPAAADLLARIQDLKGQKYLALQKAIQRINEEFNPIIQELETEYAFFIKLAG
jgi:chromosome segregation ATPase